MERKVVFVEGEYYHLYNRGVEKRIIFLSDYDYKRFILLLQVLNTNKNLKIRDLLRENSFEELLETTQPENKRRDAKMKKTGKNNFIFPPLVHEHGNLFL